MSTLLAEDTPDSKKLRLLQWLASVGPEPAHSTAYSHRATGTGLWFQQGPLKSWDTLPDGKAAVLWLQGRCLYIHVMFGCT
jgi:hypothetical protein